MMANALLTVKPVTKRKTCPTGLIRVDRVKPVKQWITTQCHGVIAGEDVDKPERGVVGYWKQ